MGKVAERRNNASAVGCLFFHFSHRQLAFHPLDSKDNSEGALNSKIHFKSNQMELSANLLFNIPTMKVDNEGTKIIIKG